MAKDLPCKRVLLVEGVDDKHVVLHLAPSGQSGIPAFDIIDQEGFPNLVRAIGPQIKVPGRLAVGILADANSDPDARWEEIGNSLRKANVELAANKNRTHGTVVDGKPRVGIWLMPDNRSAGELEDFVKALIPDGDPVWPMAVRYIEGIPPGVRKFTSNKILRAKIHAWLATRQEPRKMGTAIYVRDLNAAAPVAIRFTDWLRELFG